MSVFSYSTWPSETKVPKFKLRCSVERCPDPIIPGLSHPSLLSLKIGLWGSLEEKYVAFDFTAPVSQFSRNLAPLIMNHQHHKHHIHKCSVFSNVNWRMGKGIEFSWFFIHPPVTWWMKILLNLYTSLLPFRTPIKTTSHCSWARLSYTASWGL